MLYALLSIIAIGVLLASEEGKVLLNFLLRFVLGCFVLYLLYWIVLFLIALLADNNNRNYLTNGISKIGEYIGIIIFVLAIIGWSWGLIEGIKTKKITLKQIKKYFTHQSLILKVICVTCLLISVFMVLFFFYIKVFIY